jgi:hypothetical protein
MNPLSFGPGRISVSNEGAQIVEVPTRKIYISESDKKVSAIRFDLSSETDLHSYFDGLNIQIRCALNDNEYADSFGSGPFVGSGSVNLAAPYNGMTASQQRSDGRYIYTVYAFGDLSASRLENHTFKRYPLETLQFSKLSCFIVGVTKAPVLFPRSNEFILTHDQFLTALKTFRSQK